MHKEHWDFIQICMNKDVSKYLSRLDHSKEKIWQKILWDLGSKQSQCHKLIMEEHDKEEALHM